DWDLRIRRFTPAAEKLFNLIATDVGRPMTDIKLNVRVPDLEAILGGVLDRVAFEREVQDKSGHWYSLRVRQYRTVQNKVEGAVLLLIDIGPVKRASEALRESEARFEVLADSAPVLIWVHGLEGCQFVNRIYEQFVGAQESQLAGDGWTKFIHSDDLA